LSAPPDRGLVAFHIYQDTVGHWRWYLLADDHRRIANSGGCYMDRGACLVALQLVMGTDVDTPVFED
jgi:uncharacterized protein YegP (UPF0339 family)